LLDVGTLWLSFCGPQLQLVVSCAPNKEHGQECVADLACCLIARQNWPAACSCDHSLGHHGGHHGGWKARLGARADTRSKELVQQVLVRVPVQNNNSPPAAPLVSDTQTVLLAEHAMLVILNNDNSAVGQQAKLNHKELMKLLIALERQLLRTE